MQRTVHITSTRQGVVVGLVGHAMRVQEWAITPIILEVEVSLIAVHGNVTAATLRAEAPASPSGRPPHTSARTGCTAPLRHGIVGRGGSSRVLVHALPGRQSVKLTLLATLDGIMAYEAIVATWTEH